MGGEDEDVEVSVELVFVWWRQVTCAKTCSELCEYIYTRALLQIYGMTTCVL